MRRLWYALPDSRCPKELAKRDIGMLEICHFHLPLTEETYLRELRSELEAQKIDLHTRADRCRGCGPSRSTAARAVAWVRAWLGLAAQLGASHARVIAGAGHPAERGPIEDDPAVCASAESLRELAQYARPLGVRVSTENFRSLGCHVGALSALLDRCEGEVDLCADFGNFKAAP